MARLLALLTAAAALACVEGQRGRTAASKVAIAKAAEASSEKADEEGPNMTEWEKTQGDAKAAEAADKAKASKMAAVNKILTMLEDVRAKVISEGEEEAKSYSEFACFCKDTMASKLAAITAGKDEKDTLESSLSELSVDRDKLDGELDKFAKDVEDTEAEVKAAKNTRSQEMVIFRTNSADLKGALEALKAAIQAMKASKPQPSMLQVRGMAQTLRTAAILADTLGLMPEESASKGGLAALLQQGPDVPMENYKFHSGEIIETLEKLQKDFTDKLNEIDQAEVSAAAAHDMDMQEKSNKIKTLNTDIENAKASKAEKVKRTGEDSAQLTVTSAELLDDQQYLEKLAEMCQDKKKTWDKRMQARQDEVYMLTEVLGVIGGTVANQTSAATVRFNQQATSLRLAKRLASSAGFMEAAEAAAEAAETAPSFLQRRSAPRSLAEKAVAADRGREAVVDMLRSQGQKLKSSALMALAGQIAGVSAGDPFAKIKLLIQELIERLLNEAAGQADQKAWCDKATSAAEQKREYSSEKIKELNAQMAEAEALRDKLVEQLGVLSTEIDELEANREKADAMRTKEKEENNQTIEEAKIGLEALQDAMDIIDKFYKAAAKNKVELVQQGPADDAPDAGFDNFEAYTGAQGEGTGIIGMMEVLEGDFKRTISTTETNEAEAESEHLEFMTESGKSLAEKKVTQEQKDKEKTAVVEDLSVAQDDLTTNSEVLQTSITELLELKKTCIDTGMDYDTRKANREEEIEALKKAMCILDNYAEYGPDGAADNC